MGKLKWIDSFGREFERECNNLQEAKDYCEFIGLIDEYNHPVFVTETKTPITK